MKSSDEMKDSKASKDTTKSSNPKGKGNRSSRRSRRSGKDDKFYKKTEGSNDLAWHSPDAELLNRTANMSWSYQTGELLQMNKPLITTPTTDTPKYASQGGFCVIRDAITVGGFGSYFNYQTQPTYNAANSLLTTMRSRTRVRNTYDAPDIMMLMIAMDNIYAAVAFAKRAAATVSMYTYQNHYMPKYMLEAQGLDADWFAKNQFQFVTELNVLISEINKIYIPSRMHLFELHNSRFSNYYTEGSSIKDQIYFFTPAFLSEIDYNATEDYQSMVKPIVCLPGTLTITDGVITGCAYNHDSTITGTALLQAIRQMVTRVVEHDSTADITGDMENAFGPTDRFVLSMCDPNAVAAPIFDEEILETIHNTAILYGPRAIYQSYNSSSMTSPYFSVVQDVNTNRIGMFDVFHVQKNASVASILHAEASFRILDVHKDPSAEKTFEITRIRPVLSEISADDAHYNVRIEFGADLPVNLEFYRISLNGSNVELRWAGFDTALRFDNTSVTIASMEAFHYRPLSILLYDNYTMISDRWFMGETDIFTEIPDLDTIKNMNRLSLLTLLGAYNNV